MAARRRKSSAPKTLPIGLVATDRLKTTYAVVPRHRSRGLPESQGSELEAQDLVSLIALDAHELAIVENSAAAQERAVVSIDRLLGLSVRRIDQTGAAFPGRVMALRGALKLQDKNGKLWTCAGLIEIEFDEYIPRKDGLQTKRKQPTPQLRAADAGALVVSTADGHGVGIVIGGSKRRAFVVPLASLQALAGLRLGIPTAPREKEPPRGRERQRLKWGTEALIEELAREPSLELAELPERAA